MDAEELEYKIEHIPVDDVARSPIWSRKPSEAYIQSLADDIAENGLTNLPSVREKNGRRQLVTAHCRHLALEKLRWGTFPCRNYGPMDDETAFRIHLSENGVREGLNPIEEAETLRKIKDELKCPIEQSKGKLTKKYEPSTIHDRLVLLNLDETIRREIASGKLAPSIGVELARCTTKFKREDEQQQIFKKALGYNLSRDSVRGLVKIVLSDRYAAIPEEIKAKMLEHPFVTAEHISILFLPPKDGDDPRRKACRTMRNEDKILVVDAVSKKRMSPKEMIEYAEEMLEKRNSKKRARTERPPQDVQIMYELEQAADTVRVKAEEVMALLHVTGEHAAVIRQCIRLLDRTRRRSRSRAKARSTVSSDGGASPHQLKWRLWRH